MVKIFWLALAGAILFVIGEGLDTEQDRFRLEKPVEPVERIKHRQ